MKVLSPFNEEDKQRVVDEIVAAFAGVPVPQYEELIIEQSVEDTAAIRIQNELAGLEWENITQSLLKNRWPAFGYLTPQAIQYYLPAILMAALDSGEIELLWASVNELTPSAWFTYREGMDERFDEQFSLLTPEQELAVVGFLGLFLDADDPATLGFRAGFAFRMGWDRDEWPALQPFADFYRTMHHFDWPEPDDPEVADLVSEIWAVFGVIPYPGDENICVVEEGDESAIYALEFQGLDWRTIHPALLVHNYASLSFFTPEGFRYFIPAYLIADLVDLGISNAADPVLFLAQGFTESADTPTANSTPSDEPPADLFAFSAERMAGFSRPERNAILRYLEYKAQFDEDAAPEINEALDRYWKPSLNAGA
jgi:hypothetical protein